MGGLIPDWKTYNDSFNAITRPLQMGPLWCEAKQASGMPMHDKVWKEDPPASSFPACIAVKCAARQSHDAEEKYLRLLREAVMLAGKNISRHNVLTDVAGALEKHAASGFSKSRFESDLLNGAGHQAFRDDLKEIRYNNVIRFPTMTISKNGKGVVIVGFRPYDSLLNALKAVSPDIKPNSQSTSKDEYLAFWNSATEREIAEIH